MSFFNFFGIFLGCMTLNIECLYMTMALKVHWSQYNAILPLKNDDLFVAVDMITGKYLELRYLDEERWWGTSVVMIPRRMNPRKPSSRQQERHNESPGFSQLSRAISIASFCLKSHKMFNLVLILVTTIPTLTKFQVLFEFYNLFGLQFLPFPSQFVSESEDRIWI